MFKNFIQLELFTESNTGIVSEQEEKKESYRQKVSVSHSELSRKGKLSRFGKNRNPFGMGFNPDMYHTAPPDREANEEIGYVGCDSFNIDKEYAIPDECFPGERRIPDYKRGEALLMEKEMLAKFDWCPMPSTDSKKENGKTRNDSVHYNRYGRKNGRGDVA